MVKNFPVFLLNRKLFFRLPISIYENRLPNETLLNVMSVRLKGIFSDCRRMSHSIWIGTCIILNIDRVKWEYIKWVKIHSFGNTFFGWVYYKRFNGLKNQSIDYDDVGRTIYVFHSFSLCSHIHVWQCCVWWQMYYVLIVFAFFPIDFLSTIRSNQDLFCIFSPNAWWFCGLFLDPFDPSTSARTNVTKWIDRFFECS